MPLALGHAIQTGRFHDRSNRTSVSARATGRLGERADCYLCRIRNTMTCALASFLLQMSTVAGTDLIGGSPAFALTSEENSVIRLFEDSRQGVVYITNLAFRRDAFTTNQLEVPQGAGSGIVWPTKDEEGGIVVTNFHVVRGSVDILVALNESEESVATIVGVDEDKDIAVLKLQKSLPSMKPVKLAGTTKTLKVGMKAYAIGNPFGLDHTLTAGVISGLGRELASAATGRPIMDVIQTDCSINPGNSGGPLLNSSNEVIGINTAIFSSTGMNAGVGFAINVDDVRDSVEQILKNGKVSRPLIGITFAPEPAVDQLGIQGVLVVSSKPGSPAEAAGIKGTERDEYGRLVLGDIITAINGQQVKSTSDLFKTLNRCKVGDEIQLQLQRGNEAIQVSLTLTSSS
jgi:S1-C subfamily serine protease